jgi:hypothetical protein
MHVPVISPDGEAKFWFDPKIELAVNSGVDFIQPKTEIKKLTKVAASPLMNEM